ncbi:MAG: MFS transporter [Mesorhizobium sp.]|uniref:alpha-ketoacid dehydrogenase subunit alpha/beta n=1 Tax=Mesorhizobium sp. TaxID=1871066 RepID=UPI000FEAA1D5|nr:alpha-ketoacid dehydrogenase subunit alpha/beta [Mesorhizobium sp.]RWP87895.1 MAG: MFS transporter [Mesorhizobium sp.]
MVQQTSIQPSAPWLRLDVDDSDWTDAEVSSLVRWYHQMLLIRRFEEKVLDLANAGLVHGPAHASIGQEATAVGAMSVLGTGDRINGTHRAHHQVLAKLVNAQTPGGFDPLHDAFNPGMQGSVRGLMAEIMGLKSGYCGGRGGSMHMRDDASGIPGTSAIIGGNLPHAAGYALADKLLGTGNISVAFFGDGTMMAGPAYEAMNIAALYRLPVIFFAENNLYAVSTHINEQTRETRLASRGPMLGFRGIECDGMDVVAVHHAMREARRTIEEDGGPVLVEALCYRFLHQSGARPGSEFGYRTRAEEDVWKARDPLATMAARLKTMGILNASDLGTLDQRVMEVVNTAADSLTEMSGNALRIPDHLWPDPSDVDNQIRGDLSELKGERFLEIEDVPPADTRPVKFMVAASEVIARAMEQDARIIIMGEDVHRLRGGVSGATKGALERWPERVLAMPIAENGFVGVALGAALCGLRPMVEIMFGDFCLVAADQLFNAVSKVRHMFGGGFPVPIVVRVRVSPHTGYGSQHSGDPSGLFALFPGWRIVAPTTPFDYIGLMNSAMKCDDPVVVIEHVELFPSEGPVPADDRDYCVRLGKAKIVRPGSACTLLTSASMVAVASQVVEETGVDAEIIDLRSLDPTGLDWPLVEASIRKTNRVAVIEQVQRGLSLGGRLTQEIQDRVFDYLDHEILHVTGSLSAPVVSAPLNRAALGGAEKLKAALQSLTAVGG